MRLSSKRNCTGSKWESRAKEVAKPSGQVGEEDGGKGSDAPLVLSSSFFSSRHIAWFNGLPQHIYSASGLSSINMVYILLQKLHSL